MLGARILLVQVQGACKAELPYKALYITPYCICDLIGFLLEGCSYGRLSKSLLKRSARQQAWVYFMQGYTQAAHMPPLPAQ